LAKKIVGYIKLQIPAGKANPSPPVGPALGQRGLNIMQFVKEFNAVTQQMEPGMPVPVVITAFADRTFSFVMKTPPNTYFLKKAAGIEVGAKTVGTQIVGKVTKKQIEEIAKQKMPDLNAASIETAVKSIKGTARSMGVDVVA
jgi:large subunit ribosomal protein L11